MPDHENDPLFRRLDLETPLEAFTGSLAIGVGGGAAIVGILGDFGVAVTFGLTALALWVVRSLVDCSYFLDAKNRQVVFIRRIVGFEQRSVVCSYDQVAYVSTDWCLGGKRVIRSSRAGEGTVSMSLTSPAGQSIRDRHWLYWTALVSSDGRVVQISDPRQDGLDLANRRASWVADEVGAVYLPGEPQKRLRVEQCGSRLKVEQVEGMVFSSVFGFHGLALLVGGLGGFAVVLLWYLVPAVLRGEL